MKNAIRFFLYTPLVVSCLFLVGCGMSAQQQADVNTVHESGVTPVVYDKMLHEEDLSFSDVKGLCAAHVSEGLILRYMRDRETVYFMTVADIDALRKAGASESLIDFMLQTARAYQAANGYSPVVVGSGAPVGPTPVHWHDPWYWNNAPGW